MKRSDASTPKLERKTVERNRRICMRNLCNELAYLIAPQYQSGVAVSQSDRLEQAADCIKKMEERINELRSRKRYLTMGMDSEIINRDMSGAMTIDSMLPIVEVSGSDSTLNVVLSSGFNKNVKLSDVITVLEEEGTEVVKSSRVGCDSVRINKRLMELIH
ncbi:hypothetical protein MRB53_031493 [Persea americana]|uniref:Uncharacterized protein n=1 Tax=Persea americana TaxID=3435 RepID=A0ACC2KPN7_PERAE|nr:hypothetical protein MRB53_031493 [Persea americana]